MLGATAKALCVYVPGDIFWDRKSFLTFTHVTIIVTRYLEHLGSPIKTWEREGARYYKYHFQIFILPFMVDGYLCNKYITKKRRSICETLHNNAVLIITVKLECNISIRVSEYVASLPVMVSSKRCINRTLKRYFLVKRHKRGADVYCAGLIDPVPVPVPLEHSSCYSLSLLSFRRVTKII